MSFVLVAIAALLLAFFLPKLYKYHLKMSRLRSFAANIPGPEAIPIIGNALQVPTEVAEWTPYFTNLANESLKRGENVLRFWMLDNLKIMPLNGESVKDILDNSEEITKSNDYDIIEPWLGTGLLIATGSKWRHRRKMLTPTFHFSMLDGYVETFDREARIMSSMLSSFAVSGETVDIFPYIKRCALDVICDTAMGVQLNSQQKNHPYAVAVGEMGKMSTLHSLRPYLWFAPLWYLLGYGSRYNKTLKTLTDFTKNIINDRRADVRKNGFSSSEGKKKAFLDLLLELGEKNSLSDEDIREEVDTFMFAGHDTTSAGTAWILFALACHPEIQEKVHEELIQVFGENDRSITVEDLKSLPYMERVIKESKRVNPPVPWIGRHLANDTKIGDYIAPKDSVALISPLLIHRNEQAYPNPLKFDPDRFLPENVAKRHMYDYIPFSAGPRNCVGQKFAQLEEKVMVSWMIRKFRISTKLNFNENGRCSEVVLRPQFGVPIQLERR